MGAVFVKKAYNNMQLSVNVITNMLPDKFALKTFNYLVYNWEISSLLVASYLLGLPNHYTLLDNVKSINLAILQKCFSEFALYIYKTRLTVDDFLRLRRQISASPIIFDHYHCQGSRFQNFYLFIYIYVISIYLQKLETSSDIKFESSHPKYQTYI